VEEGLLRGNEELAAADEVMQSQQRTLTCEQVLCVFSCVSVIQFAVVALQPGAESPTPRTRQPNCHISSATFMTFSFISQHFLAGSN